MNRKIFLLVFTLGLSTTILGAQNDSLVSITESNLALTTSAGYNNLIVGELSIGVISNTTWQDSSKLKIRLSHSVGSEFWLDNNKFILVPKYTFYIGLKDYLPIPFTSGFSILYASDFSDNSLCIRLEYGLPIYNGRIFYSYNIPIYNRSFVSSYVHQITFSWSFRISKKQNYKTYYNKETDSFYEINE